MHFLRRHLRGRTQCVYGKELIVGIQPFLRRVDSNGPTADIRDTSTASSVVANIASTPQFMVTVVLFASACETGKKRRAQGEKRRRDHQERRLQTFSEVLFLLPCDSFALFVRAVLFLPPKSGLCRCLRSHCVVCQRGVTPRGGDCKNSRWQKGPFYLFFSF